MVGAFSKLNNIGFVLILCSNSSYVFPVNGGRPMTVKYKETPNDHTSPRPCCFNIKDDLRCCFYDPWLLL